MKKAPKPWQAAQASGYRSSGMSWPARTVVSGGGGFVVDPGRGRGHFYFASTAQSAQFGGLTGIAPVLYNLLEVIAKARHMRSEILLRPHSGFSLSPATSNAFKLCALCSVARLRIPRELQLGLKCK
jgi:hypothetical protein